MHIEHLQIPHPRSYTLELNLAIDLQKNWLVDRPQELVTLSDNLVFRYTNIEGNRQYLSFNTDK